MPEILMLIILICAFVLRIFLFSANYPVTDTVDPGWEYLLSSHVVMYHEFPLVGTKAFQGSLPVNSPSYIYLLALPLIFHNSIYTLLVVNIFLQVIFLFLSYLLAAKIFSKTAGLFLLVLLSFSDFGLESSKYFFQPYVMQPFFLSAILVWIYGVLHKNSRAIYASIAIFILSCSLYLSAVAYIPIAIGALIYTVYYKHLIGVRIRYIVITAIAAGVLCFGSTFYSIATVQTVDFGNVPSHVVNSFAEYSTNIESLFHNQTHTLFSRYPIFHLYSLEFPVIFILIICITSAYIVTKPSKSYTKKIIVMLICFIVPLLVQAVFRLDPSAHFMHLSSVFFLFFICGMCASLFQKNIFQKIISVFFLISLLYSANYGFNYVQTDRTRISGNKAAEAILHTATYMHLINNGKPDFSIIRTGKEHGPDYQYWQLLESISQKKYVTTDLYRGEPLSPFGAYVFISCVFENEMRQEHTPNACDTYLTEHPDIIFIRSVYNTSPFTVYLAKIPLQ